MRTALYTVALSAALLLTASTASVRAEDRDCTVDLKSMCAGIAPGEGHIRACLQAHMSRTLRGLLIKICRRLHGSFEECHGDIQHFCPQATYGNIADCMRPHLGEASDQCRAAIAFIASPAGDR